MCSYVCMYCTGMKRKLRGQALFFVCTRDTVVRLNVFPCIHCMHPYILYTVEEMMSQCAWAWLWGGEGGNRSRLIVSSELWLAI